MTERATVGEGPSDRLPAGVARGVEVLARRAVGGRVDAVAVLTVRVLRRLSVPAFILGVAWLLLVGRLEDATSADLASPGNLLAELLSPLAGVALAILLRLATGMAGLVLAVPRAHAELMASGDRRVAAVARVGDLAKLAGALRALRLTSTARDVAAGRLGTAGRVLLLADRGTTWLVPASIVAFILVSTFRG